jgi:hypothetical protein
MPLSPPVINAYSSSSFPLPRYALGGSSVLLLRLLPGRIAMGLSSSALQQQRTCERSVEADRTAVANFANGARAGRRGFVSKNTHGVAHSGVARGFRATP